MYIRKTEITDLSRIMEIYAHARKFMAETGNPKQWGATMWPPEELIREDIAQGNSYVCIQENQVIAVFYYVHGRKIDPTYDHIEDGAWIGDDMYGVVHRIACDHSIKGIGSFCISWAYEQCGHLRMDTHGDNIVMRSLLEKLGFERCGIIYVVEDNDPRIAYEKI